jgi:dihydroflavonol-4-reductase
VNASPSQDVLVTGATGFVGGHLVEALVARGDQVRCLVRPRSDRQRLPPSIELVPGSIDDESALGRAVTGVNVVYHLAAVTSAADPTDYDRVNRAGVERVLAALMAHAPRGRLVFCSSLAAAGPTREGRPLTETDPPAPIGPYGVSKANAERAIAASAVESVIVRPPAVYGPRDRDVLAAFKLAAHGIAIRTGPARQRLAFIHVEDLVRGLIQAGRAPGARGVYYVNGANHEWEEIMAAIGRAVGRNPHVVAVPPSVVAAAGRVSRGWARVTGRKPLLTPERARDLVQPDWTCDDGRARRELGYAPRVALVEGMQATADWYRAEGWLAQGQNRRGL